MLGTAIFAASRDGRRFRFRISIVVTYLLVAVLHGISTGVCLIGPGIVSVVGGLTLRRLLRRHCGRDRKMSEARAVVASPAL